MVAESGNVKLAERKIGEYSGGLQRKSQNNVLPRDGGKKYQCPNPNVSVSKNTTSVLKPLMHNAIPTWQPKNTLLMRKQGNPVGCAGPVKTNLGASECRQLGQEPHPDSKSTKNPQCATQAAQTAMGQKCTPDRKSYAEVISGASLEPTRVDRPISSDSSNAVSGQADQEMTGGIQLQQSDRSQNQKPAKTNVPEKLPSLLTLKITAVQGNVQLAGRKTGDNSDSCSGESRKNVLPRDGDKESQCPNPNVSVSENLTSALNHPDSKSTNSKIQACAILAADLAMEQKCKPAGCAGPVKPNLGADECRELIQEPHSDSKSENSEMPPCATLEEDLEMGQKCTPDIKSYAEVISGASQEPTNVDRPISSDSRDAVSGQTDQETTGGIQLQQSDRSHNQKPAKTNVQKIIPSLLTLKIKAVKGNAQLAGRKTGEQSGSRPGKLRRNVFPQDGGKKSQCSNTNVSVSENMISATKQFNHLHFPRGQQKKTVRKPKQSKPMDCAGPVKPKPRASEIQQENEIPHLVSKSIDSQKPPCATLTAYLAMGQKCKPTVCAGPGKPNLGADECRELIHEPHCDSKSINSEMPQCATLAADLEMGQKCTPERKTYADVIRGASPEPTNVDRPISADSSDAVSGQADQEMTGGIQLQQSDRSQNQKPARTNVQKNLPSLLTLKIRAGKANVQLAGKKTGEQSARRPMQSRKNVLPQDGGKESQCPNPNISVSENLTSAMKQLNYLHFPRGKPKKTVHKPKQSKPMGCAGPVKPNPRASESQQQNQIPHPDSKSIDSQKPPCATLAVDLAMGQKCTPDIRSYAEVISGASLEPTNVDRLMSSDSSDAVSGQADQEMTRGFQLQQSDRPQNQKPAKTNMQKNHPSLLTLKIKAIKGNVQLAGRKNGEQSARRSMQSRKNVLPQDGGKGSQCSNPNVSVSENLTSAVKQLNHLHFPREKPKKTVHKPKQSKPLNCAGPVKPTPRASESQQPNQIPHPDSMIMHSQKPPCATLAADLEMGQTCKPTGCAGPVKPNLGSDDCRELIQEPHSDSKSTSSEMRQCATLAADLAIGQTCTFGTRSYADVVTGASSKPTHVDRPISSDAVSWQTDQEMTGGMQLQQSDRSHHQQPAKTKWQILLENPPFLSWSPLVNYQTTANIHHNTDTVNWPLQHFGHSSLDSYDKGYPVTLPDHMASDSDNDPLSQGLGSSGRPSPDTNVAMSLGYSCPQLQFMESQVSNYRACEWSRRGTRDQGSQLLQLDHLLQVPAIKDPWSCFYNDPSPCEPLTYKQYCDITKVSNYWACKGSRCDTRNEGSQLLQLDHLLQVPDIEDPWSCFHNDLSPWESLTYEQYCDNATLFAGGQLPQTAADMYTPYDQTAAPVATSEYHSAASATVYQVQTATTSSDSAPGWLQSTTDLEAAETDVMRDDHAVLAAIGACLYQDNQTATTVATSEYHSAASATVYQVQTATTSSDSAAGWPQPSPLSDLETAEIGVMRDDPSIVVAIASCL